MTIFNFYPLLAWKQALWVGVGEGWGRKREGKASSPAELFYSWWEGKLVLSKDFVIST